MKEDLRNWSLHLDQLSELSQKDLSNHVTKSLESITKKRSWIKALKLINAPYHGQTYPKIIDKLQLETAREKVLANKLAHLFMVSLLFFKNAVEQQDKILESRYKITQKRHKSICRISKLLDDLKKEIRKEETFLNYYTSLLQEKLSNKSRSKIYSESIEDYFLYNENYLGFMSQEIIEQSIQEKAHVEELSQFILNIDRFNKFLDPVFFEDTHLKKFKKFNLGKLKSYVLYQLNLSFGINGEKQIPWKFYSDYFDTFFTLNELQDNHPTSFPPQSLQSKFRSENKMTSKK